MLAHEAILVVLGPERLLLLEADLVNYGARFGGRGREVLAEDAV